MSRPACTCRHAAADHVIDMKAGEAPGVHCIAFGCDCRTYTPEESHAEAGTGG